MDSLEKFSLDGLDELDTQIKLFHLGVESFSPYASKGKIDMIIRSENGEEARYADIKVCSGTKSKEETVTWELEISFFMKNESFIILTVRLPEEDETFQKHHFVIRSSEFLSIVKKQKLKTDKNKWILTVPYSDIIAICRKSKKKLSRAISRTMKKYFDNWDILIEWRNYVKAD